MEKMKFFLDFFYTDIFFSSFTNEILSL